MLAFRQMVLIQPPLMVAGTQASTQPRGAVEGPSTPPDAASRAEVSEVKLYWTEGEFHALSLTHGRAGTGRTRQEALEDLRLNLETALQLESRRPDARPLTRQLQRPWWLRLSSILGHVSHWRRLPTLEQLRVTTPR